MHALAFVLDRYLLCTGKLLISCGVLILNSRPPDRDVTNLTREQLLDSVAASLFFPLFNLCFPTGNSLHVREVRNTLRGLEKGGSYLQWVWKKP